MDEDFEPISDQQDEFADAFSEISEADMEMVLAEAESKKKSKSAMKSQDRVDQDTKLQVKTAVKPSLQTKLSTDNSSNTKQPGTFAKLAETRKELEQAKKKANEEMFEFLRNVKDADGNPKGESDYQPPFCPGIYGQI